MVELALILDKCMFKNHLIFCKLVCCIPPYPLEVAMFVPICPEAELRHGLTWNTLKLVSSEAIQNMVSKILLSLDSGLQVYRWSV